MLKVFILMFPIILLSSKKEYQNKKSPKAALSYLKIKGTQRKNPENEYFPIFTGIVQENSPILTLTYNSILLMTYYK